MACDMAPEGEQKYVCMQSPLVLAVGCAVRMGKSTCDKAESDEGLGLKNAQD